MLWYSCYGYAEEILRGSRRVAVCCKVCAVLGISLRTGFIWDQKWLKVPCFVVKMIGKVPDLSRHTTEYGDDIYHLCTPCSWSLERLRKIADAVDITLRFIKFIRLLPLRTGWVQISANVLRVCRNAATVCRTFVGPADSLTPVIGGCLG